ncbi:MAG: HAMP domain-containing histidine kinase, partial [Gemmatimonadaceae bacterium]|nr:HAMP domain-containing histidine kinase [Gemmatimonadaceae bacterium]
RKSHVERVDLARLVQDVVALVGTHPDRAPGTRVDVQVGAVRAVIDGDGDLLHRAVFNLVLNAVQAVGDGGHVHVAITEAMPDAAGDGTLELRIEDDGPGMPDDVRSRIFTPFFTTKPQGSGLGLPVVHRAIEAHRGAVFVDSAPGRGTRFTIVLPRTQGEAGAAA